MKKLLILSVLLSLLFSCTVDDDNSNFSFEILPIESVDIPEEFTLGDVFPITVTYQTPTTCHRFRDFYYIRENNERTVSIINTVFNGENCEDLNEESRTATFNFKVTSNGSFIFKFWQGKDENDEDIFLEIEVPVTN